MRKIIFILFQIMLVGCNSDGNQREEIETPVSTNTLIVGHRGASGYLPEHTLEAYALAIEQGADFIEPDLVVTKDGILIARHEPMLSKTTDIALHPEFKDRKVKRMVDGVEHEDWFTSDFLLEEIKTLKAVQAFDERNQQYNGLYTIPTLEEIITLTKLKSEEIGRVIGIYPETKHSTYHQNLDLPIEDRLIKILQKEGWTKYESPVIIQSFETSNLQYINSIIDVRLIQLIDGHTTDEKGEMILKPPYDRPYDFVALGDSRTYKDLISDEGLNFIKSYADGIGVWKRYIIKPVQKEKDLGKEIVLTDCIGISTDLIERTHDKGLLIHAYTFRNEPRRLLSDYNEDPIKEYQKFYKLGLDGLFTDFPDTAAQAKFIE